MAQAQSHPSPRGEPSWDITFTRLVHAAGPQLEACINRLARRFAAIGLCSDTTVTQTPRGFSHFLALVGQRGLLCIVELTLIDGMAVGLGPKAALDFRLLDACGDVVEEGLCTGLQGCSSFETAASPALSPENLDRAATAVYLATVAHFDPERASARFG